MEGKRHNPITLRTLIHSKIFFVLCVVLLFFVITSLAKGSMRSYQVHKEVDALQKEIEHLEKQNNEFSQLVSFLKSEEFVEREAKLKLGLKNEGESVVIISQDALGEDDITMREVDSRTNPQKWFDYFFNNTL